MGRTGPVPKRSDQVRRTNNKGAETKIPVEGTVTVPEVDQSKWHPLVRELWASLPDSGQSRFYEPSDWAMAAILMEDLSHYMRSRQRSGVKLSALMSAFTSLLITEGDRRRVRLEIERADAGEPVPENDPTVAIMADYRKMAQ